MNPYLKHSRLFQVLAVQPGPSGQPFLSSVLEKIRFLREEHPDATIEVDGGINLETAKLVKEFGADTIVSSSYIFNSPDPKRAYQELSAV
jgi:ribulose-phosphate 3-epimerase